MNQKQTSLIELFPDIKIRPLLPGDRQLIDAFYGQMSGETRAFFNVLDDNRLRTHRYLDGDLPDAEQFIAVTRQNGMETVAGYCFLWELDFSIPWVGIAVGESWKGRHLGSCLLSFLIEHAKRPAMQDCF